MSSSYKLVKRKTLATRKKTRKRKILMGMGPEDESGRLFQPPSRRDPRWKKPSAQDLVASYTNTNKKQKVGLHFEDDDEDEEDDNSFSIAKADTDNEEEVEEEQGVVEEKEEPVIIRRDVHMCATLEDCLSKVSIAHQAIRKKDGRQKAKVLILCDTSSIMNKMKEFFKIKTEPTKSKSKLGVSSSRKPDMVYRNIGALKTPIDRFAEKNEPVLKDYKCGKVPTLVAEDVSYYPYSDLKIQHFFLLCKSPKNLLQLDQNIFSSMDLHVHFYLIKPTKLNEQVIVDNDISTNFNILS
jgi:hypothetical protein